jgi:hypothetical protein
MTTAEKLVKIAENEQKVYEAGQKAEYDRFWDAYQEYGTKNRYNYAFAGWGWTDDVFKPKYNIAPNITALAMFQNSRIVDLKGVCERCGITHPPRCYCRQVYTAQS